MKRNNNGQLSRRGMINTRGGNGDSLDFSFKPPASPKHLPPINNRGPSWQFPAYSGLLLEVRCRGYVGMKACNETACTAQTLCAQAETATHFMARLRAVKPPIRQPKARPALANALPR